MAVSSQILDGTGDGYLAAVNSQNALKVTTLPLSSRGLDANDLANIRQLREFLVDASSSNAMNVDGSTTSVEFTIAAAAARTRWVTGLRLILEGVNLEINTNDFRRFGAAAISPGLTNGVEIITEQQGETVTITKEPVQNIGSFLTYNNEYLNLVNSVGVQEDLLRFDFSFDQPVVLVEGSLHRVVVRINDDLTATDKFVAIARGYEEGLA